MKYIFLFGLAGLASCVGRVEPYETTGYVPVYMSAQAANKIETAAVQATAHPGKIYAYGNYLFQVEQNEGIHVIDNSDPKQAKKISFIKIPSCSELSIRSNFLYTNNINDLVVFDISNVNYPQLVSRVKNVFPEFGQSYPPLSNVFFECPDPSKGIVVGWEQKAQQKFACHR